MALAVGPLSIDVRWYYHWFPPLRRFPLETSSHDLRCPSNQGYIHHPSRTVWLAADLNHIDIPKCLLYILLLPRLPNKGLSNRLLAANVCWWNLFVGKLAVAWSPVFDRPKHSRRMRRRTDISGAWPFEGYAQWRKVRWGPVMLEIYPNSFVTVCI